LRIRLIAAAAALSMLATGHAFAQAGWNSQTYFQNGPMPQTYYNGTGANQGWSGNSQTYFQNGPMPQTYSNFTGPNGQSVHCQSQTFFANGPMPQTSTNCY
jgi:hypothetical protein